MPLNENSIRILEQTKKSGKPCNFVLLCKGAKPVSMVAYRKGSKDGHIKEAKKIAKGEVSSGVIDGNGVKLAFKLLKSEGYEAPPVKTKALKDFLGNNCLLNIKPTFEIVAEVPQVEPEEESSDNREGSKGKTPTAPKSMPPSPPTPIQTEIKARQKVQEELDQDVKKVDSANPKRKYHDADTIRKVLAVCKTDNQHDLGKALKLLADNNKPSTDYDTYVQNCIKAKQMGFDYLKSHKDPMVGKLPKRVKARKQFFQDIMDNVDEMLTDVAAYNQAAVDLAITYAKKAAGNPGVPPDAMQSLAALLTGKSRRLLSAESIKALTKSIEIIKKANRKRGYELYKKLGSSTEQEKAEVLSEYGCYKKPEGGTSEIRLLQTDDGKIAYAFKLAEGEPKSMGLPKGGGSMRESVTSKVCDLVLSKTGYDFGFPKSDVVKLGGKVGALVEGLDGTVFPEVDEVSKLRKEKPKEFDKLVKLQNSVPGKDLQKLVFCGVMTGNVFDIKWENAFFQNDGDGKVSTRPFDAGASFLPSGEIEYQLFDRIGANKTLPTPLFYDLNGDEVKGSKEALDPKLVKAILALDLKEMKETIEKERTSQKDNLPENCLDNDSIDNGLISLECAKKVLSDEKSPPKNLLEFFARFGVLFVKMVEEKKKRREEEEKKKKQ